jgi:hypothetical protein
VVKITWQIATNDHEDDVDWIYLAQDRPVEGSCEHGKKPWEILEELVASQDGVCSMKLQLSQFWTVSIVLTFI